MPNRQRLKDFQLFAKSLIQDNKSSSMMKSKMDYLRSQGEEHELRKKIAEFEKAHPGVDLTALFDSDLAEEARRALHKKAYASYKAYNFLKNGVKTGKEVAMQDSKVKVEKESNAKRRLRERDPYNFPALNKRVEDQFTSESGLPQLADHGEMITTPGRRVNGYT